MSLPRNLRAGNRLLDALPKKDYQSLQSRLEETPLVFERVLYQPNEPITEVYFPTSGVVSLLASNNGRSSLEVGLVGKEGIVGLPIFMGVNSSPNRAVVQGAGSAMKIKASLFRKESNNNGPLQRILQRYAHSRLTQVTQTAVCNQFHPAGARLARWLLMTHDRMENNEFQLTQEFLSNMLGVRRERVSTAAGELQKRKLIQYARGRLEILDRAGLEAASCGCYDAMKNEANSR
jgi:CRP-like cAMP-binding protein